NDPSPESLGLPALGDLVRRPRRGRALDDVAEPLTCPAGAVLEPRHVPCHEGCMNAPVLYMVRAWVSPAGGDRYLRWLETKHMAEVCGGRGFLGARKCRLEQTDHQGWAGYLLIYGLQSRAALDAYLNSAARERFWRGLEPLNDVHYAERFYGSVDFAVDHGAA